VKTFVLTCLLFITTYSLHAQDNNEIILGFTFAPQGISTFENDPPFQVITPLYLGPTWLNGKWGVNPFYSFGGNSAGVFLTYAITNDFGSYLVLDQSLNSNFGVYGVGLTTPLFENYVQGFVELARSYGDESQESLAIGMFISFGRTVKTW